MNKYESTRELHVQDDTQFGFNLVSHLSSKLKGSPYLPLFISTGVGDGQNADRWKEGVRLHEVTLQNVMLKNVKLHEVPLQNFTSNEVVLRCIT